AERTPLCRKEFRGVGIVAVHWKRFPRLTARQACQKNPTLPLILLAIGGRVRRQHPGLELRRARWRGALDGPVRGRCLLRPARLLLGAPKWKFAWGIWIPGQRGTTA